MFGVVKPSGRTLVLTNCYFHQGNLLAKSMDLGSMCNMLPTIKMVQTLDSFCRHCIGLFHESSPDSSGFDFFFGCI